MGLIKYLTMYRIKDMVDLINNEKIPPKESDIDLTGKVAVITGATSGIGLETAKLLSSKGASLILLNRNLEKSMELEIKLKPCNVKTILVDFNSLDSVRNATKELIADGRQIDYLIHNAGVFNTTKQYSLDNIEMVFQVNHLGAFLMNHLLMDKLIKDNHTKIIYVNSEGHRFALGGVHLNDLDWKWHRYTGLKSYGASKTAQLLTMERFRQLFNNTGVTINAMHPGNVTSNMGNNNGKLYRLIKKKLILSSAKDPVLSAKAIYYLISSKELEGVSGKFYNLTTLEKPAPHGRDFTKVDSVWDKSMELCGLK